MQYTSALTIEELLPAMIELASIQHDLLSMDVTAPDGSRSEKPEPTLSALGIDGSLEKRRFLLQRSHVLLSWLVGKARSPR